MAQLIFRPLSKSDPQRIPVLIIGQTKHLEQLRWSDIKLKLEPQVSEETFKAAVSSMNPSPTDVRSLYLNFAKLAVLPTKWSRHNTPSQAHSISKLVQSSKYGEGSESVVIVCEKNDVLASACAVARVFPLFNCKSSTESQDHQVSIEFLIVPSDGMSPPDGTQLSTVELQTIENICSGVRLAARIVDAPCNLMNVDLFLEEVQSVGSALNITPLIIRDEELNKKGFGGIYGVGKAAKSPPALAVLSYTPEGAQNTIAWVGKGIVYDTGGLSLKGKTAMPGMKRDCGGAAGILGAFYAAVKANFTENLHAVFCLAENSVGPNATRPDDIHTLYSGRTVEINNTDAEGRLVLADGVAYANKDLKANIILDMATLTGAQGISTGKYHAAVLTNDGPWEDTLMQAGLVSGDLVFPIPFCPELHFSEFASAVADMKNSVADRENAQASCAGLFIASHLGFEYPGTWIHVDMAYPVHSKTTARNNGVVIIDLDGFSTKSDGFLARELGVIVIERGQIVYAIMVDRKICQRACNFTQGLSWNSNPPTVGENPAQIDAVIARYRDLAEEKGLMFAFKGGHLQADLLHRNGVYDFIDLADYVDYECPKFERLHEIYKDVVAYTRCNRHRPLRNEIVKSHIVQSTRCGREHIGS